MAASARLARLRRRRGGAFAVAEVTERDVGVAGASPRRFIAESSTSFAATGSGVFVLPGETSFDASTERSASPPPRVGVVVVSRSAFASMASGSTASRRPTMADHTCEDVGGAETGADPSGADPFASASRSPSAAAARSVPPSTASVSISSVSSGGDGGRGSHALSGTQVSSGDGENIGFRRTFGAPKSAPELPLASSALSARSVRTRGSEARRASKVMAIAAASFRASSSRSAASIAA